MDKRCPRPSHHREGVMELPANYNLMSREQRRDCRIEYMRIQNFLCHHCGQSLYEEAADYIKEKPINKKLFPDSFFKFPIHLHHNHDTGMTIGAVHNYCNAVLWQYHGE